MSRDIINVPALRTAVDEALEGRPSALRSYLPDLKAYLHRAASEHDTVRKARRRKSDPPWAQKKFDAGHTLHRFKEAERTYLIRGILRHLMRLEQVVDLAKNGQEPFAHEAGAFLRGLSHRWGNMELLEGEAGRLIQRSERAAHRATLSARRYDVVRTSAEVAVGALTGRRCVSIDEIRRLGRTARNCLVDTERYWTSFLSGQIDLWGLREGGRLFAVLEVDRDGDRVIEAKGPSNVTIGLGDAQKVALLCRAAGLEIGPDCEGLLPEYAEPLLMEPRVVVLKRQVARYAEWPTAVRIDLSSKSTYLGIDDGSTRILSLSFDPDCSLAAAILGGQGLRNAVAQFGRAELRKIVRSIVLDQTTPTLVQHRLLTLAV